VPPRLCSYIQLVVMFANDAKHRAQSMEVVMAVAVQDDYSHHLEDYQSFLRIVRYVLAGLAVLLLLMLHFLV
jgi:hypothetical protein